MVEKLKHNGFSLTEVLMAVGILSIGMMLIATMFPVGIYLTSMAAERTMAAAVADEAFAKIQLYGLDTSSPGWNSPQYANCTDYNNVSAVAIDPNEFSYPSVDPCATANPQYYWSALCRLKDPADPYMLYQVTVFVARKTSQNLMYLGSERPEVINISVQQTGPQNELQIITAGQEKYINPPTTILDNATGRLYRVVDRVNNMVTLDRDWTGAAPTLIWLVPPPDSGGKNAGIEVYQRIMRF